jgi:hypothetical protein
MVQVYYVPTANPDPYPADFTDYINSLQSKIGAETTWQETNDNVYSNFAATGKQIKATRLQMTKRIYRRLDEELATSSRERH